MIIQHWRTGHGTGVLRAYHIVVFMRGITAGVLGTYCLHIAQRTGAQQNLMYLARGVGQTLGPLWLGGAIGHLAHSGESQGGFAMALLAKMVCEVVIPRTSSCTVLYIFFFLYGLAMNFLDTAGTMLVEMVYGKKCALPLLVYCAIYGFGAMVAPFLTIALQGWAWVLLALIDLAVASAVLGRRLSRGKPSGWKAVLEARQAASDSEGDAEGGRCLQTKESGRLPVRIFRAGVAFVFLQQAAEHAVGAWAFTFASSELGLPARQAALFPSTFYLAFTSARLFIIPLSARLLPSTIAQAGVVLILAGALVLNASIHHFRVAMLTNGDLNWHITVMLGSLVVLGVGTSPQYACLLAAMRQHGRMTPEEHGLYNTTKALGQTLGMWLPGLVVLPLTELICAAGMWLIFCSHVRDFPWRSGARAAGQKLEAVRG